MLICSIAATSILRFWEEIKQRISYQSYVIDFAILPCDLADSSLESYPVIVIELNPFVRKNQFSSSRA